MWFRMKDSKNSFILEFVVTKFICFMKIQVSISSFLQNKDIYRKIKL